jgi:hypothetical protein
LHRARLREQQARPVNPGQHPQRNHRILIPNQVPPTIIRAQIRGSVTNNIETKKSAFKAFSSKRKTVITFFSLIQELQQNISTQNGLENNFENFTQRVIYTAPENAIMWMNECNEKFLQLGNSTEQKADFNNDEKDMKN